MFDFLDISAYCPSLAVEQMLNCNEFNYQTDGGKESNVIDVGYIGQDGDKTVEVHEGYGDVGDLDLSLVECGDDCLPFTALTSGPKFL